MCLRRTLLGSDRYLYGTLFALWRAEMRSLAQLFASFVVAVVVVVVALLDGIRARSNVTVRKMFVLAY